MNRMLQKFFYSGDTDSQGPTDITYKHYGPPNGRKKQLIPKEEKKEETSWLSRFKEKVKSSFNVLSCGGCDAGDGVNNSLIGSRRIG